MNPHERVSNLKLSIEDLFFDGSDPRECDKFIASVRKLAIAESKQRDDEWMADFAGSCFVGKALRWYESLDDEVQCSWKQLRRALLAQYSYDEPEERTM